MNEDFCIECKYFQYGTVHFFIRGGRGVLKKNMALKRGVKRKIVGIKAEGLPNKFL